MSLRFRAGRRLVPIAAAILVFAQGCASLSAVPFVANAGDVAWLARTAAADRAELERLEAKARKLSRGNSGSANRLKLTLVLSAPRANPRNQARGISLLHDLSGDVALSASQRDLARSRAIEARIRMQMQGTIDNLERDLAVSSAKIEELLDIERSMENGRARGLPEAQ